jgi:hypothetical protein
MADLITRDEAVKILGPSGTHLVSALAKLGLLKVEAVLDRNGDPIKVYDKASVEAVAKKLRGKP